MALTTTILASTLEEWEKAYFREYVRDSGFMPYMGEGATKPFVVKNQLISGGQVIHIPLVNALTGTGTGTGTLTGNEESLAHKNYDLKPYWHRNALSVNKDDEHINSFSLRKAMTEMLKVWEMDNMRDGIVNALSSVVEASGSYDSVNGHPKEVFFSEATTANKNTFAAANQYRLLFGVAESNYSATFATGLATVDAAADNMTAASVSLMKRMAKRRLRTAVGNSVDVPSITPIRTGTQGREFYVCFTDSANFSKLKTDSTITAANRDARPRDVDSNPLFQDGDLLWDGVVIREIPEIQSISATVSPAYLCGAQALGMAWGQRPRGTERSDTDYGFIRGVGTESLWACEKLRYNTRDHGMITGLFYTA